MATPQTGTTSSPPLGLVERVQARRDQLQLELNGTATSKSTRADIDVALVALSAMLTGDLAKLAPMVSRDLTRWLEVNKHLGVRAASPS